MKSKKKKNNKIEKTEGQKSEGNNEQKSLQKEVALFLAISTNRFLSLCNFVFASVSLCAQVCI